MDAMAIVNVGPCARGGKNRVPTQAADHDVDITVTVTPSGLLLPAFDERLLSGMTSNVTSDGVVDGVVQWWERVKERFADSKTVLIT